MASESREQREVREKVVEDYLPAWCRSYQPPFDPANFRVPDWIFLTPGVAQWFLAAITESVVELGNGNLWLGRSSPDGIFETKGPADVPRKRRQMGIRKESFLEVAAVARLALDYGWPLTRLTFQSPGGALDFLAYADDAWSEPASESKISIAGEAKLEQKDAVELSSTLEACGRLGAHGEADCAASIGTAVTSRHRNRHRKYLGLLKFQPRIFWIVGPDAFVADPDLVFSVKERGGGKIDLKRADATVLQFGSP